MKRGYPNYGHSPSKFGVLAWVASGGRCPEYVPVGSTTASLRSTPPPDASRPSLSRPKTEMRSLYPKAIRVLSLGMLLAQGSALAAAEARDDLYATLCAACHGHGTAPVGPYPPLYGSAILATAGPAYIAIKALQGAGNMFPLCGMATDEEVTRLANDLARANGSVQPAITPAEVAVLRPAADECPNVEY